MTKYYLLVDDGSQNFTSPINEKHIRLDGTWCVEKGEIVELTANELDSILVGEFEQELNGSVFERCVNFRSASVKIAKVIENTLKSNKK